MPTDSHSGWRSRGYIPHLDAPTPGDGHHGDARVAAAQQGVHQPAAVARKDVASGADEGAVHVDVDGGCGHAPDDVDDDRGMPERASAAWRISNDCTPSSSRVRLRWTRSPRSTWAIESTPYAAATSISNARSTP